jgi:hypothetical protein
MMLAAVLMVAACGGSNQTANNPSPSPSASPLPSASAAGTPAALDPCQLVTQSEASQLAGGTTFAAGKEETTSGGAKLCNYVGQTTDVFLVEVAVAPDAATAQADWAQEKAKAQASLKQIAAESGASVNITAGEITISGADKAATATGGGAIAGHTLAITAIYLLKGSVFVTFSDLVRDKAAPTIATMLTQAQTVLTRIP